MKYFTLHLSTTANKVSNIKRRRFPEEENTTQGLSLTI
jgi:hypothetical protein